MTRLDLFRQSCNYVMLPLGLPLGPVSVSTVAIRIFEDPRRPLDRAFFESIRIYGINVKRSMTWRTFRAAVERLRGLGIVEGDHIAPGLIKGWESAWHKAFREHEGGHL